LREYSERVFYYNTKGERSLSWACIISSSTFNAKMKITIQIFSVLLFLTGFVFFLQGINVLPGSYMTGDPQWAINGGVTMAIGIILLIWSTRYK